MVSHEALRTIQKSSGSKHPGLVPKHQAPTAPESASEGVNQSRAFQLHVPIPGVCVCVCVWVCSFQVRRVGETANLDPSSLKGVGPKRPVGAAINCSKGVVLGRGCVVTCLVLGEGAGEGVVTAGAVD